MQPTQMLKGASTLLGFMCLVGCATIQTVSSQPITQGIFRDFDGSYSIVTAAAIEAVERLNVDVQGSDETPERFQIRFSKPMSAFSWGEAGVVNVVEMDVAITRVYVNTAKRYRIQITGTSEETFSEQIFANIDESLARLQP